jgi:hypothetical protein
MTELTARSPERQDRFKATWQQALIDHLSLSDRVATCDTNIPFII